MEAPGYFLYLPPTPIKARFVMLEEKSKGFYDVDTAVPVDGNPEADLSLVNYPNPPGRNYAIIIPNRLDEDWKQIMVELGEAKGIKDVNPDFEVGLFVRIVRQHENTVHVAVVGKVCVAPFKPAQMSWDVLKNMKGPVLPDEMDNGLLAKLYGGVDVQRPFVHPQVLNRMPRRWHVDASVLNIELDRIFASGVAVESGEVVWEIER